VKPGAPASPPEAAGQEFVRLLEYLKATRGFDFSGYKLSSLIRRVRKRMQQIGIDSYPEYMDYLEVHSDELIPLFNTVLINVTDFFRDAPSWQALAENILPRILEAKGNGEPIRCWSAGCASGEEAYTLAILLAEALGEQEFRQRVKIYGTDADEEALSTARQGSYAADKVGAVPADLLPRYFESNGERQVFRPDLRRVLIFGRHDLVQDAAISRLDLLVCRNTLMYFNAETQAKILARFHFALNRQGYLFLGRAETLLTHGNSFHPVDLKRRIFQRAPATSLRERMLAFSPASALEAQGTTRHARLRESAFNNGPAAQIVFDRRGFLVLANDKARQLFGIVPSDLGRPIQDLELSYRPVELRSHIDAAYASGMPVIVREIDWRPPGGNGESRSLELQIVPLIDVNGGILGAGAAFVDQTLAGQLRADLDRVTQELETAFEEVQSSNEELETTNEELQSTIEELETTNEELQSANEELETMNEELQSTNEELRTLNDQVQQRSEELDLANGYLRSILAGLRAAVVVLSTDLHIEIWSDKAQELWGLRSEEVRGQPFLDLDIGLPVRDLRQPLLDCLENGSRFHEVLAQGINRRGRSIQCRVTCTPLVSNGGRPAGVILLMEDAAQPTNSRPE
jgi:two-component system, chemotaxis family, CheB/CheR fusion protein